jgi:hypothetical protein
MRTFLGLAGGGRVDHCAIFHAFAEGLARMLSRRNNIARVRAVRGQGLPITAVRARELP